jgi:hypothetical protein
MTIPRRLFPIPWCRHMHPGAKQGGTGALVSSAAVPPCESVPTTTTQSPRKPSAMPSLVYHKMCAMTATHSAVYPLRMTGRESITASGGDAKEMRSSQQPNIGSRTSRGKVLLQAGPGHLPCRLACSLTKLDIQPPE